MLRVALLYAAVYLLRVAVDRMKVATFLQRFKRLFCSHAKMREHAAPYPACSPIALFCARCGEFRGWK